LSEGERALLECDDTRSSLASIADVYENVSGSSVPSVFKSLGLFPVAAPSGGTRPVRAPGRAISLSSSRACARP
jgi:hypothetical protein